MRRLGADGWGGVVVTIVCLAISAPVVVVGVRGGRLPLIPNGWWLLLYAAFAAAFLTSMWLMEVAPRRVTVAALAAQSVLAPVLVLTAPSAGWTPILLVFAVAVSAYSVPEWVSAVLVAVNTAVVGIAASGYGEAYEIGMVALLYLALQAASVLSVKAMQRETRLRRSIAEAHVRLRAAGALLAESSRAEERLRIARELHDLLGHQLTVLSLELEIASHRRGSERGESVDRAKELARELLGDVRATVGEMREDDARLREVLEAVVSDLPEPVVHLRIGASVAADAERTRLLVRCVQEVVTNAIRHARAENLWIDIVSEDGRLAFEARDDGVGAREVVVGNGLRGMAERLESLGGTVRFSGADGFSVRAEVPAA
ncbi:sensor histidine kinase [Glycomyces harbinensis]|nr:histidine kinase [Glycomyces harbinensis]